MDAQWDAGCARVTRDYKGCASFTRDAQTRVQGMRKPELQGKQGDAYQGDAQKQQHGRCLCILVLDVYLVPYMMKFCLFVVRCMFIVILPYFIAVLCMQSRRSRY